MKIGNWEYSGESIDWKGKPFIDYHIDATILLDTTKRYGPMMYDWLIHLAEKSWISAKDAVDLQELFIHVSNRRELDIDPDIMMNTIREMQALKEATRRSN